MEQIHRTIKKARATFPPGGDTHKEFLNTLQREGAINCRMAVSYTHLTLPTKRIV